MKFNLNRHVTLKEREVLAVEAENIIQTTDIPNKNILRARITHFLNSESGKSDKPQNERKHLNSLKKKIRDNDLIVSKADKGRRVDYVDKPNVTQFLSSDDFALILKDPTPKFFTNLKQTLDHCQVTLEYFNTSKNKLYPMNPKTPRLYGLPKVHKQGYSVRPVVSYVDSPCQKLSSWLHTILKDITGFTADLSTNNSITFTKELKDIETAHSSAMLFPSIPPAECTELVKSLLIKKHVPPLICDHLILLISTVLDQDFFLFNGNLYRQKTGLTMGSCLSPLFSEVFMNAVEQKILNSQYKVNLNFYRRYVDDIFIL